MRLRALRIKRLETNFSSTGFTKNLIDKNIYILKKGGWEIFLSLATLLSFYWYLYTVYYILNKMYIVNMGYTYISYVCLNVTCVWEKWSFTTFPTFLSSCPMRWWIMPPIKKQMPPPKNRASLKDPFQWENLPFLG